MDKCSTGHLLFLVTCSVLCSCTLAFKLSSQFLLIYTKGSEFGIVQSILGERVLQAVLVYYSKAEARPDS